MSSKNNVNKDFYTVAGRDRPGEDLVMPRSPRDPEHGWRGGARPNFIPGAAPVGGSPVPPEAQETSAGKTGVRSGSRKRTTARRGGTTPGTARPKAGASGDERRRTSKTKSAKRRTTRPAARAKRRAASTRRSRGRRAA